MSRHMSPWLYGLLWYLRDGEWHDRHEAIDFACRYVPPGVALRRRNAHNRRRREKHNGRHIAQPKKDIDSELLAGRRQVVRDSIYGATSLERKDAQIRITAVGEGMLNNFSDLYGELVSGRS